MGAQERRTGLSRRGLLGAAVAAPLGAAGLAACGADDDGRTPDSGVRLRFLSLAWQQESIAANKRLVAAWNKANPKIKVVYEQGSWDNIHDYLVTSFEGGEAPDIIHDASDDLSDFALGGYLADLGPLLPKSFTEGLSADVRAMGSYGGRLYGVPFLQEPRVLIANRKLLDASGVRLPGLREPWSWADFEEACELLSSGRGSKRKYGVAWPLKEPVSVSLNLSLGFGGQYFETRGTQNRVRFGAAEQALPKLIHRQVHGTRTAPAATLGMGGSDALPGFFDGRYAMLPLGFSYRQQVSQQAPKGFEWQVLPAPKGPAGSLQGVSPQTLSIAHQCRAKEAAAKFIAFFLAPEPMARLAAGDWLLPTTPEAARQEAMPGGRRGRKLGWDVGVAMMGRLRAAPSQRVRGYAEWKDKIAAPAFQEYYAGQIKLDVLRERLVGDGNNILERYARGE
jgi:ABC-type glycerol-3-phosphate transport system substrate-binding protein